MGCTSSVIIMIGLLGYLGWKVTVISSNFIALMLILNMAMNIHMTVRYLQIRKDFSNLTKNESIIETTRKMFLPILYTVLTTICAFLSLIFSGIKPIIDFGWMMTLGLIVSITVTFFLLPSLLNLLKDDELNINEIKKSRITSFLSKVSQGNSFIIFGLTIIIVAISVKGITKLEA